MFLSSVFLFTLISISCVTCNEKKPCALEDFKCTTESISRIYPQYVIGGGGIPTSEPLCQDVIEGQLPSLWYKYTNGSLSGMKDCRVDLVRLTPENSKYETHMFCPHLSIEMECEVKGEVRSKHVGGKGICKVDHYDNNLVFSGNYEIKYDKNGYGHMFLETSEVSFDCLGKVDHDYKNIDDDCECNKKDNNHELTKDDWRAVEKLTRQSTAEQFLRQHLVTVKALLQLTPIDVLFSE